MLPTLVITLLVGPLAGAEGMASVSASLAQVAAQVSGVAADAATPPAGAATRPAGAETRPAGAETRPATVPASQPVQRPSLFVDVTRIAGLPSVNSSRLLFTDLNGDGQPDVVMRVTPDKGPDTYRVFIHQKNLRAPLGFRYIEVVTPGLPTPGPGDCIAFADLDNDGRTDAIFTRYLDLKSPNFTAPPTMPTTTAYVLGFGDGTFDKPVMIPAATLGTTACLTVGDANGDGLPDIALGNWYDAYGVSNSAYPSDLLIQQPRKARNEPITFVRARLPEDAFAFDPDQDLGPRPTYGILFARLTDSPFPSLLQINYGRRANRLYVRQEDGTYVDRAPALRVDGDEIRHGRYPDWLKELGKTDKRFDRDDEKPYRSHGNGFDAAVGDINNDGKFDLFVSNITHAWAGESSDRSRFLVQQSDGTFAYDPRLSVDRPETSYEAKPGIAPSTRPVLPRWNQGDLFARLADVNLDGRLDLILASSDYPDPAPHENRLRIYLQQPDGRFADETVFSGVNVMGAQRISLVDVDEDGDLDLLVGQSFNRFPRALIDAQNPPAPVARLYLNRAVDLDRSLKTLTLRLVGDPARGVPLAAYNTIVRVTTVSPTGERLTQSRQYMGPGGHSGKGGDFFVNFALPFANEAERVEVYWPTPGVPISLIEHLPAGRHTIFLGVAPK